MAEIDRLRFDRAALENHAGEYCRKELDLTRELVDALRTAAFCAPAQYSIRTRRCMNDADQMTRYFSKMRDTLIEVGQLVDAASNAVLQSLENADDLMKTILK